MTPMQRQLITDALNRLRKGRRIKWTALADELGVHPKYLYRLRSDRLGRDQTSSELQKINIDLTAWAAAGHEITLNSILRSSYPDTYVPEFAAVKRTLWITGLNLRRITSHRYHHSAGEFTLIKFVEDALTRDVKVKILFIEPKLELCKYAAMQDWGSTHGKGYMGSVRTGLKLFCDLLKKEGRTDTQVERNLEIRTIDYPLGFGIDAIDADPLDGLDDGKIYVRFYPIFLSGYEDQPIIRLTPAEGLWYDFYKKQFARQWELGREWVCQKGEALPKRRRP